MKKILNKQFFNRDVVAVTSDLLGKFLVREVDGTRIEAMIVEVEAYDGEHDLACHASRGQTPRNAVMYGHPGRWYVYLCYGMHHMLNIVTGEKDYPAAALIRGVELDDGTRILGPGRVTKFFHIDKKINDVAAEKAGALWIEDRGMDISARKITRTARIGVTYAGPIWAKKPYRFVLE